MSQQTYKIRLKKDDTVIVLTGKYKGKTGKVLATHPRTNKVTVEGLNVVTRHQKPSAANPSATPREITRPIDVSKVAYYDSTAKKASRVGYKLSADGKKTRLMKSTKKEIK